MQYTTDIFITNTHSSISNYSEYTDFGVNTKKINSLFNGLKENLGTKINKGITVFISNRTATLVTLFSITDEELETDITEIVSINIPPKKEFTIKAKINSIEKGSLKIFLD